MEGVQHPEFRIRPSWHETGNACFPTAANVQGEWWVLRINNFPDHPMWTLFVNGERRFDVDDPPSTWGSPARKGLPSLSEAEAVEALRAIADFTAYGSEVGTPCDNPFCCA